MSSRNVSESSASATPCARATGSLPLNRSGTAADVGPAVASAVAAAAMADE